MVASSAASLVDPMVGYSVASSVGLMADRKETRSVDYLGATKVVLKDENSVDLTGGKTVALTVQK